MKQLTRPAPTRTRSASPRAITIAIVATAVLMSSLDLFIVNVALPKIAQGFGGSNLSDLSWVINAYAITFAAGLIPAGRLSDRWGHKRMLIVGLILFTITSAACGLSPTIGFLAILRALQGISAAMMTPSSLGVLLETTPAAARAGAVRLWAALGGLGAALGPVLGGALVQAGWQWVFLINVPIGIAGAVTAWVLLLPSRPAASAPPGWLQTIALVGTVASAIAALVNADRWGWLSAEVAILGAIAIIGACVTVYLTLSGRSSILNLELMRSPGLSPAMTSLFIFHIAFGAMLLSITLWTEDVWGWTPLQAGLAIAPGPTLVPIVAILAGRLTPRVPPVAMIVGGATTFAIGIASWALAVGGEPNYAGMILPGMILTGIGVGLALPSSMALGTSRLPSHLFATGSGLLSMSRQLGIAVGIAVAVAAVSHGDASPLSAFHRAWWITAVVAVLAGAPLLRLARPNSNADRT